MDLDEDTKSLNFVIPSELLFGIENGDYSPLEESVHIQWRKYIARRFCIYRVDMQHDCVTSACVESSRVMVYELPNNTTFAGCIISGKHHICRGTVPCFYAQRLSERFGKSESNQYVCYYTGLHFGYDYANDDWGVDIVANEYSGIDKEFDYTQRIVDKAKRHKLHGTRNPEARHNLGLAEKIEMLKKISSIPTQRHLFGRFVYDGSDIYRSPHENGLWTSLCHKTSPHTFYNEQISTEATSFDPHAPLASIADDYFFREYAFEFRGIYKMHEYRQLVALLATLSPAAPTIPPLPSKSDDRDMKHRRMKTLYKPSDKLIDSTSQLANARDDANYSSNFRKEKARMNALASSRALEEYIETDMKRFQMTRYKNDTEILQFFDSRIERRMPHRLTFEQIFETPLTLHAFTNLCQVVYAKALLSVDLETALSGKLQEVIQKCDGSLFFYFAWVTVNAIVSGLIPIKFKILYQFDEILRSNEIEYGRRFLDFDALQLLAQDVGQDSNRTVR